MLPLGRCRCRPMDPGPKATSNTRLCSVEGDFAFCIAPDQSKDCLVASRPLLTAAADANFEESPSAERNPCLRNKLSNKLINRPKACLRFAD